MRDEFVDAIKAGKILSVEWAPIQDMLGEEPQRELSCSLCEDGAVFPPTAGKTQTFCEKEIADILHHADVNWMAELHAPAAPIPLLGRTITRYFAVEQPSAGMWFKNPNKI